MTKTPKPDKGIYRNLTSYGDTDFSRYMRRAFLASAGYDEEDLRRPIIGVVDTSSDYNTCHRDMPPLAQAVKRGVLEAGGLPFAFPTSSWNEILTSPTTMLYRNLLAMETEELICAQPMDAVVLLGGCDKTVPAQLMAAATANIPALSVVIGPMRTGRWRGERLGACTDCRRNWAKYRSGELSDREINEIEGALCATGGTCMVMGTASTMACLAETLGMMLPGGASPPSGSADRLRQGVQSGRRAVQLAREGPKPRDILVPAAFRNALRVLVALGGSTNAIVHLTAIARRAGHGLTLDMLDTIARQVPLLVDCKPAGSGYMEDFHHAGGLPSLLKTLEPLLERDTTTAAGPTLETYLQSVPEPGSWQNTIRTLQAPLGATGSLRALRGSLAPRGAVIKAAAATRALLKHRGPAALFESPEDVVRRIDDPALGLTAEHVLILRNAGPVAAGMPEAGAIPIPKYLAVKGVKDMVRVTDARMSGTAYGTIVLHCTPEAAAGGPLALVEDGDLIELDVEENRLDLLVDKERLAQRKGLLSPSKPTASRGWKRLYTEHVLQADQGADLDFLV